jgi:SNF2 family DNA or RNA helicase
MFPAIDTSLTYFKMKVRKKRFSVRLMHGRMKCFHSACGTALYENKGDDDFAGEPATDAEMGPAVNAKAARADFIMRNQNSESSRLSALMEYLVPILHQADSGKILIFDPIVNAFKALGIPFLELNGWMSLAERDKAISQFQDPRNPQKIMLITIQTGGVGLTLTQARHVFIMTMGWNPFLEQQAEARANRVGQVGEVTAYYFYSHDTIERAIAILQATKRTKASKLLDYDSVPVGDVATMKLWDFDTFVAKVSRSIFLHTLITILTRIALHHLS